MISRPKIIELTATQIRLRSHLRGRILATRPLVDPQVRPVLKWAGGKQWLAPAAPHLVPNKFHGRYYEPFLGAGAFYFALQPRKATISDTNGELIQTYNALRSDPESIIDRLELFENDAEFYYRIRSTAPRAPATVAARLIYLNRTCWNGLYRVNRNGRFNTPFGQFTNPAICDDERLLIAGKTLGAARIIAVDFETAVSHAKCGDFVYFDPPYITGHKNNGFLKYNAALFSWDDQLRLAQSAIALAQRGVHVLVSNADHASVASLYRGFYYYRTSRRSAIGSQIAARKQVDEALFANYPLLGIDSELL